METKELEMDLAAIRQREDVAYDLLRDHTYDLADGRMLRLIEEPDYYSDIRDWSDCYGIFEHIPSGRHHNERPALFNGAARKLWVAGDCYWWQPPADIIGNDEAVRAARRAVCNLIEYGTTQLRIELCEGDDAYGQPTVREFAVIGGIEFDPDYGGKAIYVADLLAELGVI